MGSLPLVPQLSADKRHLDLGCRYPLLIDRQQILQCLKTPAGPVFRSRCRDIDVEENMENWCIFRELPNGLIFLATCE